MRLLILSIFLIVQILGSKTCNAQGVGTFQWTNGAPNNNPGLSGAKFAVDKNTYRWYEWAGGTTWVGSGDRIQSITGCSAPNYTPTIHQSWVVINNCDPSPELYAWNGAAWKLVEGGGSGVSAKNGLQLSSDTIKLGGALTQNTTISKTSNEHLSFNLNTNQEGQRVIGASSIKTIEHPVSTIQVPTANANGAIVVKLNQSTTNYADFTIHISTPATRINNSPIISNSYLGMDIKFGGILTPTSTNISALWEFPQNYEELEFALTNKRMVRLAKEANGNYVFIIGDTSDYYGGAYNGGGNFQAFIEKISLLDIFGYDINGAKPTISLETNLSAYTILATEIDNSFKNFTTATRPVTQEKGYYYYDTEKQSFMVFNGIQYEPYGDATPLLSPNTSVKFDRLREYGSVVNPVSGNITIDNTNTTNVVRCQKMYHSSSGTPSFPAGSFIQGIYLNGTGFVNVIDLEYRGVNQIFIKINQ